MKNKVFYKSKSSIADISIADGKDKPTSSMWIYFHDGNLLHD